MSQPRDRRVVPTSPTPNALTAQLGVAPQQTASAAPQVTLDLSSFKLEELGFPVAIDDLGSRADAPIPLTSSSENNITSNPANITTPSAETNNGATSADRMMATTTSLTSVRHPIASTRSMLGRRSTHAPNSRGTPPLLPPINSQSHLLELLPTFSSAPLLETSTLSDARSPFNDTTRSGNTSASETDVVLTSSTPRRVEPLSALRQRFSNVSSSSNATRRIFRPSALQRSAASSNAGASPQPRVSLENSASSHRSPELPPLDISDNSLGGLTSLLYNGSSPIAAIHPSSSTQSTVRPPILSHHRAFLPPRPFVESPSPPIINTPTTATTISSTLGGNWARIQEFEEAMATLRNTPPPSTSNRQHRPPRLSLHQPNSLGAMYPPVLPHPFEETMSPSTASEDEALEYSWESSQRSYRDELRYIYNLNTVLDEREAETSGELTPVLTVPSLPPILPSPLLIVDAGLGLNEVPNPSGERTSREEETEWEADEVPSAWLREARRHLINSGPSTNPSTMEGGAPLLELPNFSSTSLGLGGDFPHSSSPGNHHPLSSRISAEQLRQLPTEQLRQLRRFAVRSLTGRSRSRSSLAPSMVESIASTDSEARGREQAGRVRPESVVSNEDIVVGVPPMLDEPFEGSVWRALESSLQEGEPGHHLHHRHYPQEHVLSHPQSQYRLHSHSHPHHAHHPPAPIDTRRQPRVSLPPMSSGLGFDGNFLAREREIVIDPTASNASVRPAVPSASSEPEMASERARVSEDPGLGEWRELVEGTLSSQSMPALALTPPPISTASSLPNTSVNDNSGIAPALRFHRTRSQASHARSASTGSGETFLDTTALRQQFDLSRFGSAGRDNSLALAVAELGEGNFRPVLVEPSTPAGDILSLAERTVISRNQSRLAHNLSRLSQRSGGDAEAFRILDNWWSDSPDVTMQIINRELEYMERVIAERSPMHQGRSLSPLWDTDDPLSDFLSDVGFDGSYEALLALGEQLGVVPRGISDSTFASLKTNLFKELEPELVAMSPAMSIGSIHPGDSPTTPSFSAPPSIVSTPASPSRTSFTATRMTRKESGKWVAQCSICLEEFAKEDVCVTLECTHFFHQLCVREWLRGSSTCPLCRHALAR